MRKFVLSNTRRLTSFKVFALVSTAISFGIFLQHYKFFNQPLSCKLIIDAFQYDDSHTLLLFNENKTWTLINNYSNMENDTVQYLTENNLCQQLFEGDKYALQTVSKYYSKLKNQELIEIEYKMARIIKSLATQSCLEYIIQRQYLLNNITQEEKDFPLAFGIVAHTRASQTERLLRAIYSPTNFYCIHVDKKANKEVQETIQSFSRCFGNVHVITDPVNVYWGEMSVLEAHLICMRYLYKRSNKWKYFLNMAATEFPVWGNPQLVKILRSYNGANDMEGYNDAAHHNRWKYSHLDDQGLTIGRIKETSITKSPPPHGLIMAKGMVSIAVSRGYVETIVSDNVVVKDFLLWLADTWIPDESFFTTLNHNPDVIHIPGGFDRPVTKLTSYKTTMIRKMVWFGNENGVCGGVWEHDICLYGERDMTTLADLKQLFINKLDVTKSPVVYMCMEKLQRHKTISGRQLNYYFNTTEYSSQIFVTHQQKVS